MHSYLLTILLNHSIIIPVIISAIRFKTIGRDYRPFIFLLWLGLLNETISLALIYTKGFNTINSNIYVLLESGLLLYQFYSWQTITRLTFYIFFFISFFVWTLDNLIWHHIYDCNAFFRLTYSIIIIGCSIRQVNGLIEFERFSIFRNATFLICFSFLLYYSCKSLIEVFYAFRIPVEHLAMKNIFMILYVDDFISNIIYTIALLCIPKLETFSLPY